MTAVAVSVFVVEPIWNSVRLSTATGCSTLVTPAVTTSSSSPRTIPTPMPGMDAFASSAVTSSSSSSCSSASGRTGDAVPVSAVNGAPSGCSPWQLLGEAILAALAEVDDLEAVVEGLEHRLSHPRAAGGCVARVRGPQLVVVPRNGDPPHDGPRLLVVRPLPVEGPQDPR